jgi:hypothetical protein
MLGNSPRRWRISGGLNARMQFKDNLADKTPGFHICRAFHQAARRDPKLPEFRMAEKIAVTVLTGYGTPGARGRGAISALAWDHAGGRHVFGAADGTAGLLDMPA